MKTDDNTLADALDILARDIQSDDGVANACIAEAAQRIRENAKFPFYGFIKTSIFTKHIQDWADERGKDINAEDLAEYLSYRTKE